MAHIEKEWTKTDVFEYFDLTLDSAIANSGQIEAGMQIIKKTSDSVSLINEWLAISNDYHLVDDSPSYLPNAPSFKEHRHDQSIYSLLMKIHGIVPLKQSAYSRSFIVRATRLRK